MSDHLTEMSKPAGLLARVRGTLDRPLSPDGIPFPARKALAFYIVAVLGGMVLLGAMSMPGPSSWTAVLGLAALIVASEQMPIRFSRTVLVTCSEIFLILAVLLLPPADAAMVALLVIVPSILSMPTSWIQAMNRGMVLAWSMAAAIVAANLVLSLDLPSWSTTMLAAITVFVVHHALDMLVYVIVLGIVARQPEVEAQTRRELLGALWTGLRQIGIQAVAQIPTAVLGVWATAAHPFAPVLLLVPYLVAWHSARQEQRLEHMERKLGRDALTGLLTRERFMELVTVEIAAAERYGHPLAFFVADLDDFKRVNDRLGHLAGDAALRSAATAMRDASTGTSAIIGRYGGEEIVVAAPAMSRDEVLAIAEEMRDATATALHPYGSSISIGVGFLRPSESLEELLDRADKALYAAKYDGKNCVFYHRNDADELGPIRFGPEELAA